MKPERTAKTQKTQGTQRENKEGEYTQIAGRSHISSFFLYFFARFASLRFNRLDR